MNPRLLNLQAELRPGQLADHVTRVRVSRLRPGTPLTRKQLSQIRAAAMEMGLEELEGLVEQMRETGEPG